MPLKGKIIFLNGVTSAGKTTISKSIQMQADENYYNISNDTFQQMVSPKFLQENYWAYLAEAIASMYGTAKALSEEGINVIIDGMLLDMPEFKAKYGKTHYELMKYMLNGTGYFLTGVLCPLEICRQRNIARGDRQEGQSEWQNKFMSKSINYDFTVDTSLKSCDECAKEILEKSNCQDVVEAI